MVAKNPKSAIAQYSQVDKQSKAAFASPHALITMLLNGALEKIAIAKGCMQRKEIKEKGHMITWSINIIDGLRTSLDMEKGGDLAQNLEQLYDYMMRQLVVAHARNDETILDEVSDLLKTIKSGWEGIADTANQAPPGE